MAVSADVVSQSWPKVVLFGDSLTQYSFGDGAWGGHVADLCQRRCDVMNRGFSGYTSATNKVILPYLLKHDFTPITSIITVIILLGSNDAVIPGTDDRTVTLESYESSLTNIIEQFVKSGVAKSKIILLTPPPVVEEKWSKELASKGVKIQTLSNERTGQFAKQCMSVGKAMGVEVIDINHAMQQDQDWPRFLHDGLHFSREGNEFVAKLLLPVLKPKIYSLPVLMPDWKDIDFKHIEESFEEYLSD